MKKILIYIIIFAIFCLVSEQAVKYSIGKQIENQAPYHLSFASIGANLLESRLDSWAKIKKASSQYQKEQILLDILASLDLPSNKAKFYHEDKANESSLYYELQINEENYLFIIQDYIKDNHSYFLLTAISSQDDKILEKTEKKLEKLMDCRSYYSYTAKINSDLNMDQSEELLKVVMKSLKANSIDIYKENNSISMTAYTPSIELSPVYTASKKYNVQAAIKTDVKEKLSYVYLGFPLLLNDY